MGGMVSQVAAATNTAAANTGASEQPGPVAAVPSAAGSHASYTIPSFRAATPQDDEFGDFEGDQGGSAIGGEAGTDAQPAPVKLPSIT